jgi:hypothetical protein
MAQIEEVAASIPTEHHEPPADRGVVSSLDSAILHLNNWAFLNGHAYVTASGSAKERRWRYKCVFSSRAEGMVTQNSRRIEEVDRVRVNTHTRGLGCPVAVTISQ